MLNALRKQAVWWVVKALLMLLVVSVAIWGSGGVFYGGLIAPAALAIWDMGRHKLPVWSVSDAFAPGIALATALAVLDTVRAGGQVPGTAAGVQFSFFDPEFVFNDAAQTAFLANLMGTGVTAGNNRAIFSENSGTLALVARLLRHDPAGHPGARDLHRVAEVDDGHDDRVVGRAQQVETGASRARRRLGSVHRDDERHGEDVRPSANRREPTAAPRTSLSGCRGRSVERSCC